MARFLIVGGFLALVFWIFSVVDCAVQPATRHRGVSKGVWILIVLLLPVIGGVLWFVLGRSRGAGSGERRGIRPDDDPVFLGRAARAEQDARIRELEEELARLDDDADGSSSGPRS